MINFASNLNKMINAGLGGPLDPPRTEVAVGHRVVYTEASGAVANFETNVIAPVKNLLVTMEPIQAGSGDPSPENIRPITGRDTVRIWREAEYDPSAAPAITIQLGQTVYGGTVDVTTGMMTVDRAMIDLGSQTWGYQSTVGYFYTSITNPLRPASWNTVPRGLMSDRYATVIPNRVADASMKVDNGISIVPNSDRLMITNSAYTDAATFKTAMSGAVVVYELATPQTIQLTPAQLSTLAGENNVWSDAGNISLEYPYYEETEGY